VSLTTASLETSEPRAGAGDAERPGEPARGLVIFLAKSTGCTQPAGGSA